MKNRLDLNWKLESARDRKNFLTSYLMQDCFIRKPPTDEEIETMANYILWGRNENGENIEDEGLVELPRRNTTWKKSHEDDSLDALLETPTFNEGIIRPSTAPRYTQKKEVFDRTRALTLAPTYLKQTLINLFYEIDKLELLLNYYDLLTGKRKTEPREELLHRFSDEEKQALQQRAESLSSFSYLKMRHLLVELRREQFTYRDFFVQKVNRETAPLPTSENILFLNDEIKIFPLGAINTKSYIQKIFKQDEYFSPNDFSPYELQQISKFYWNKVKEFEEQPQFYIDFRELEHVYQLFLEFFSIHEASYEDRILAPDRKNLLDTLLFYIEMADITEAQKEILNLKIHQHKNQDIANYINQKYGKSYTANYISTIFRQKIIPKINDAARYHEKRTGMLFFPEEFKICSKCGQLLFKDERNFVHKSRSKDGFAGTCKRCDKIYRQTKSRR